MKDVWNVAAVAPLDKGTRFVSGGNGGSNGSSNASFSGELIPEENFLEICSRELLARGCELLKKTRTGKLSLELVKISLLTSKTTFQSLIELLNAGDLHWKIVSVYINRTGQVRLFPSTRSPILNLL